MQETEIRISLLNVNECKRTMSD